MNKMVLFGILFVIALMGGTWLAAGKIMSENTTSNFNMLAMFGALAILVISVVVVIKYVRQMQEDTATGDLAEDNWDGIGEYKNELPFGWAIIFLGTMIWAVWYWVAGYPTWSYNQLGEYNEEVASYNKKFQEEFKNVANNPEQLVDMGQSIFIVQCAQCHGLQADGMDGKAADLHKRTTVASVEFMENHGSAGTAEFPGGMPKEMFMGMSDAEKHAVAEYISSGFKGDGAEAFAANCAACHGPEGEGIPMTGPNIRTFTESFVVHILENGKKGAIGTMPSFKTETGIMTPIQQKAVAAYVVSLGKE